eukprot:maker-scaffold_5-snap-gene-13.4-mRNA-1 protein AED:0.15 eAED:0.15 QI:0/0.33/0.75/1/0.66/0.75/4/444/648
MLQNILKNVINSLFWLFSYLLDVFKSVFDGVMDKYSSFKVKNLARKVVKNKANKNMLAHADTLVEQLKLGPAKVKVLKAGIEQEKDKNNGTGSFDVRESSAPEEIKTKTRQPRRSLAAARKLMNKLKGESKTLDLFSIFHHNGKKSLKLATLLQHAVDCNSAVIELSEKLEEVSQKFVAKPQPRKKKSSFRLSRRASAFTTPTSFISAGTEMLGKIRIPAHSNDSEFNIFDADGEQPVLQNLDPSFTNVQQGADRPYQLLILRERVNELGQVYWIGRHQTYYGRRDKQTVLITHEKNEVYIEDFETRCIGMVSSTEPKQLSGNVKQLKNGREGFDLPSTFEHRFNLLRLESSKAKELVELREQYYQARTARALSFAVWCGSASRSVILRETFGNDRVDWAEVVEDVTWIVDEVGCTMRRYVRLLKNLEFNTPSHRKQVLKDLAEQGASRINMHSIWESCLELLNQVKTTTPRCCEKRDDYHEKRVIVENFLDKTCERLEPLYNRFDQALRRAESRVCKALKSTWIRNNNENTASHIDKKSFSSKASRQDMLSQLRVSTVADEVTDLRIELLKKASRYRMNMPSQQSIATLSEASGEEPTCTICMEPLEPKVRIYVTSCKHAFHISCLNDWFKESSVCPICRADFSQTD